MHFKKIKLFSGLLSVSALASMTGAPVLANDLLPEMAEENSFGDFLKDGETEEAEQGSVARLIGNRPEASSDTEENAEEALAVDSASDADRLYVLADEKQEAPEEMTSGAVDAALSEAVFGYNQTVLPELSVSLGKGNVYTGLAGGDLFAGTALEEAPAADLHGSKPEAGEQKLVVASPNVYLNVHAEPSLGSEVVGKMYGNDVAVALRREDDRWTRVRSGNIVGYVLNEYLVDGAQARALSEIAVTQVATVDSSNEVYQEASDYAKVIAEADEGSQYEVTESEDGWLGILTEDGEGYIPASEVTLSMAYPVAESSRKEADRISKSNVKERADHEQRKAEKADAVAELARTRAEVASGEEEETAMAVVEVALRAADAAAAQADVAQVAVSQAGEESGQAVIDFALQYVGNPYVWGGSSLTHGADCSGFVMAVYGNFGFRLPHYDVSDRSVGSPVASLSEARAGDIICYNGHVALYMGDGMIVHAQDERHGITTSSATFMHIVCIRRLFN